MPTRGFQNHRGANVIQSPEIGRKVQRVTGVKEAAPIWSLSPELVGVLLLGDLSREDPDDLEVIQPAQDCLVQLGFSGSVLQAYRLTNPAGSGKVVEVRQIQVVCGGAPNNISLTEAIAGGLPAPDQVGSPHWRHQGINAPLRTATIFGAQYGIGGSLGGVINYIIATANVNHFMLTADTPFYLIPGGSINVQINHSTAATSSSCTMWWNERRLRAG